MINIGYINEHELKRKPWKLPVMVCREVSGKLAQFHDGFQDHSDGSGKKSQNVLIYHILEIVKGFVHLLTHSLQLLNVLRGERENTYVMM